MTSPFRPPACELMGKVIKYATYRFDSRAAPLFQRLPSARDWALALLARTETTKSA